MRPSNYQSPWTGSASSGVFGSSSNELGATGRLQKKLKLYLFQTLSSILLLFCSVLQAQELAKVVAVEGSAFLQRNGSENALQQGATLATGDTVITGSDGRVAILLADETAIRLNANSEFSLNNVAETAGWFANVSSAIRSKYRLLKGELWFRNKSRSADIEIDTSHISISVRGTEFTVIAEDQRTFVNMLEGKVDASNEFGGVTAISGEQVVAEQGKAPFKRVLLNPLNAAQWTIRPPAGYAAENLFRSDTERNGPHYAVTQSAWQAFQAGNFDKAFSLADSVSSQQTYRPAERIRAITGLILNKNDNAMSSALRITNGPNAQSSDWIVRSYVEQSMFNLDAAKLSAMSATQVAPDDPEAWLQLATIHMGQGNYARASKVLRRALALSEEQDADILAASAYALAAQGKHQQALTGFERALAIAPDLASAHLGVALQSTREKDYARALESISTAVAIEPTNASYLEYFARILYTMDRKDRAVEVLERAIELDPRNPGPVYILALIERDNHNDAQAIALLNRAETLNDNRGVYRSRQLLDSDRAINSADLTLAFDPFDFFAWSESRTRHAVDRSFENYNANVMYASTLAKRGDNPLAFSAANFRSRLLSPYDGTPLDLPNDYTSFFDQDSTKGLFEFSLGSHDAVGTGFLMFGHDTETRTFAALSGAASSSDGYTGTFEEKQKNISTILKWDPTYRTGLTLQALAITSSQRDRPLLRNNYSVDSDDREELENRFREVSLGARHRFTPELSLLASVGVYETRLSQISIDGLIDEEDIEQRSTIAQFSLSGKDASTQWILGGTANQIEVDYESSHSADPLSSSPVASNPSDQDAVTQTKPYFYNVYAGLKHRPVEELEISMMLLQEKAKISNPINEEIVLVNAFSPALSPPPEQEWREEELNSRFGLSWGGTSKDFVLSAAYIESLYTSREDRLDPFAHSAQIFVRQRPEGSHVKLSALRLEIPSETFYFEAAGFYERSRWEAREQFGYFDITPGGIVSQITGAVSNHRNRSSGGSLAFNGLIGSNLGISLEGNYLDSKGNFIILPFEELQTQIPSVIAKFDSPSDREEHRARATLAVKNSAGLTLKLRHEYRDIRFSSSSTLANRYINISDIIFEYELPKAGGLFQLTASNAFNERFDYYEEFFTSLAPRPERSVTATLTINVR